MTNITFIKNENNFIGFVCMGHTNFANHGEDIVCASVSAITQSTAMGLMQVLDIKCKYKTNNKKGSIECWLPEDCKQIKDAQVLLNTAYIALKDLEHGYPDNIKVEVKN